MVVTYDPCNSDDRVIRNGDENIVTPLRVGPHHLKLVRLQAARLQQHRVGNADFSDIVKVSRKAECVEFRGRKRYGAAKLEASACVRSECSPVFVSRCFSAPMSAIVFR